MTFKEELDEQRRRLEEAQKQYFENQSGPDGEVFPNGNPRRTRIVPPDRSKFYGGGPVIPGPGLDAPQASLNIVRHAIYRFNGGGTPNNASAADAPDPKEPTHDEEPDKEKAGFTIELVLATAESVSSSPQPPINAEFILHLLLRHDEHDAVIGDLIERYVKKCERLGVRRANLWFYAEILWTALPLLKRALVKASGLVAFGEWVRRHVL